MQKKILSLGINGNVEVVGFFDDGKTIDLICPDEDGEPVSNSPEIQFIVLAKKYVQQGMSRGQAITKAANEDPESWQAWQDAGCPSIFPTGSIDDGKPENFTKLVKCNVILGMTRGKAIQKAAAELPKSHSAWVEQQKPGVYAQV